MATDVLTITKVVAILSDILRQHGDLPVYVSHDWSQPVCQVQYLEKQDGPFSSDRFPERVDIQ